jgi:8-oxo-dGTP diphosphatase
MGTHNQPPSDLAAGDYDPGRYDRPSVTADVVLLAFRDGELQVLLVRRRHWPYADHWALPGGFVNLDESLEQAARRELHEETGLEGIPLEQLHTFGDPQRDPRSRVISVAHVALVGPEEARDVLGGDDAAEARWWAVDRLPPLAFDHDRMLARARQWLSGKLFVTTLGRALLPETFTLAELRAVYEAVLREKLDSRDFRRKILAAGVLIQAGEAEPGERRVAQRYRFQAPQTHHVPTD